MHHAILGFLAMLVSGPALAGKHMIIGTVLDRNGEPVDRAIVSLTPGNVQLVTDREGKFLIDYLRGDDDKRIKLAKKTDYTLEVFKPGVHINNQQFFYKNKLMALATITMVGDRIEIRDDGANIDPALYGDETHSSGANYEGQ